MAALPFDVRYGAEMASPRYCVVDLAANAVLGWQDTAEQAFDDLERLDVGDDAEQLAVLAVGDGREPVLMAEVADGRLTWCWHDAAYGTWRRVEVVA
jgi:hypothetical protein